jgi:hypothetical protein
MKPAGGTRTPPRPWIGSTRTAPIGNAAARAARRASAASPKRANAVRSGRRAVNRSRNS